MLWFVSDQIDLGHPLSLRIRSCNEAAGSFNQFCSDENLKKLKEIGSTILAIN